MLDKINIIDKIKTYNVIELFIQKVKILIFISFQPFTQEAVILKPTSQRMAGKQT